MKKILFTIALFLGSTGIVFASAGIQTITLSDYSGGVDSKHVYVGSTNGDMIFGKLNDSFDTLTPLLRLNRTQEVSIGLAPADSLLTISTSTSFAAPTSYAVIHGVMEGQNARTTFDTYLNGVNGSIFQGRKARGTAASPLSPNTNDTLSAVLGDGWGTTGFHTTSVGGVLIKADAGGFTDTSAATAISFMVTATGSVTATEQMRLSSNGFLGVGSSTPYARLGVTGDAVINGNLLVTGTCTGCGGAGSSWGGITGTLSNQTDLQSALDAKLALVDFYSTTTSDIAEGTNLYYLTSRARGDVAGLFPGTTTPNTWTAHNIFSSLFSTNASTTNASTTNLAVLSLNGASCDVKSTTAGVLYCGTDATGAGGSGTTTDIWQWAQGLARLNTTTQQVLIGALATTSRAGLEVIAQGSNPALYLNGRVGVGTTSPDSALSVVMGSGNFAGIHLDNTANNSGYMLYANDGFGDIMFIDQYGSLYNTTAGVGAIPDGTIAPFLVGAPNGVSAVMYGKLTVGTSTDQFGRAASSTLLVDGPIESTKKFVGCDSIVPNVGAAITADSALTNCPGFVFDESTDGEVRAVTAADVNNMATTSQYIVMQGTVTATPSPAAGDGIAMRMASNNATATNSPMMEAEVRVNSTIVSTSTAHNISFVGFTSHAYSVTTGAASLNLHPTNGAYFMAASSSNNWVARTAANNVFTETDTGIAHSASTHPFQTLRVDLQESGKAVFLINGRVVAVHKTNLPVRPMTPIVTQAVATAGGAASPIQVSRLKAWLGFLGYLGQ